MNAATGGGILAAMSEINRILAAIDQGDPTAAEKLVGGGTDGMARHEQIRTVGHEQAVRVERAQFLVHRRHAVVLPVFQFLRLGVAGQLAEEFLIARESHAAGCGR
jgi:hypothetical protein